VNSKKKPDAGNRSVAEEKRFLIVVDGNPSDLFSAGKVLQRLDYIIFTAGSAEDGLQFLQMARPAAIVTERRRRRTAEGARHGDEIHRHLGRGPGVYQDIHQGRADERFQKIEKWHER
jgi:hypothetical protein